MGNFFYTSFVYAYAAAFNVVALFNRKAKAGITGRKDIFTTIKDRLEESKSSSSQGVQLIWMHCASLGEFEQGRPVLEALKKKFEHHRFVLTFFSASGYEVMKNYKGADHVFYLPFDGKANAKALIDALKPSLVLWVKYEYWYYYLSELKARNIPALLISGIFRQNQPFFKWYGGIWKQMLGCFTHLFVQNERSMRLMAKAGLQQNVSVSGDTRFDRVIEIAENFAALPLIHDFCRGAKVIVAGSTWEDDEAELIHYIKANSAIRFIIAPHQVDEQNLKDVKKTFQGAIFYSELVIQGQSISKSLDMQPVENVITSNILIIDNVGMLSRIYYYADITYVGGGFGAEGVHNVLEAAVHGKPVVHGPEFEKFDEAAGLIESGGGISVRNALELEKTFNELLANHELLQATGKAAKDYVYAHKGASEKIIQFIQENRLLTS